MKLFFAKQKRTFLLQRNYLDERSISYEIIVSQKKGKFSEQTIEYASEIDADMIMIMTTKHPSLTDYVLLPMNNRLFANSAKIPVMCINPRTDMKKYSGFH